MKKLFIIMSLLLAVSCGNAGNLDSRIEKFVDKTEKECSGYTEEQWRKSSDRMKELMEEFEKEYDNLSDESRAAVAEAYGRYIVLVSRIGIDKAMKETEKAFSMLPGIMKGVFGGIDSIISESIGKEEIGKMMEESASAIEKSMEKAGRKLDRLSEKAEKSLEEAEDAIEEAAEELK